MFTHRTVEGQCAGSQRPCRASFQQQSQLLKVARGNYEFILLYVYVVYICLNRYIIISRVRIPVSHRCFHLMHCHHPRNDYYITYDVLFLTFALWYHPSSWTLPPAHYHQRHHHRHHVNAWEATEEWHGGILGYPDSARGHLQCSAPMVFLEDLDWTSIWQWQSLAINSAWGKLKIFKCVSVA